jgi:hypothetical protein
MGGVPEETGEPALTMQEPGAMGLLGLRPEGPEET